MSEEKFEIENPLGKLLMQNVLLQSKLDVLIEANAMILAELRDTEYADERNKLHDKIREFAKIYGSDLLPPAVK